MLNRLIQNREFERVDHAIKMIEHAIGQVSVQDVADKVCLGIKQFERTFSKYVGVNPKKFASIVRFQNVMQMKRKHTSASMSQLAFENGYYDQSHFIHDFKSLTDLTPKAFFNDLK